MSEEYNDYPCDTCSSKDHCDGWEARSCCRLCEWLGGGNCENCEPWDI
jgi:hypothetical protein